LLEVFTPWISRNLGYFQAIPGVLVANLLQIFLTALSIAALSTGGLFIVRRRFLPLRSP